MPWSHKVYDLLPQWHAGKLSISAFYKPRRAILRTPNIITTVAGAGRYPGV